MQIAIVIIGLLVFGAIVGSVINFGSLFLGIPLALIFIGLVVGKEFLDRQRKIMQMKRFRRDAQTRKAEFSEADKRTMV
jgi:uncharacterized membrane protein YdjX (TVP38/TMEM64 family)